MAERIRIAVVGADPLEQLLAAPVGAEVDVEALAQHRDAGLGDLLRDEDAERLDEASRGGRDAGLDEHPLGRADARAVLDLVAELGERHLEAGERREDVEGAEVAAVGDPEDLALQVVLAAVGGDPELAQRAGDLAAVDRLRQLDRGDDVGALVRVAVQLEAERGDAGAGRAGEQIVAGEDVVQPLGPRSCRARRRAPGRAARRA